MPRTMSQALAGYLGSNTTASPGGEGETIFIAETNDWGRQGFTSKLILEALTWAMKIKELIEKATEALHGAIKGERRPRPIVFDSIKDLSNALIRAKEAHSEFESGSGAKDYNWPLWYAAYIATEQGVAEKSASKLASSAIEVSPGSENAPPRVVSFLHLRPVAISVSYLNGNPLDHERDGSETSRQS